MALDHARDTTLASAGVPAAAESASVMGRDILVTGNIEATVDLLIEGRVIGDVSCATLVLGQGSSITGKIRAERVRVSGKVDGAIETVDLAIEATAHVIGDISYTRLRIANGSIVAGTLIHKPGDALDDVTEAKLKLVEPEAVPDRPVRYYE